MCDIYVYTLILYYFEIFMLICPENLKFFDFSTSVFSNNVKLERKKRAVV